MDVIELKNAFNLSESRFDKMTKFINQRIHLIHFGESPLQNAETPKAILHIVPINSFDPQTFIDFTRYSQVIKEISTIDEYAPIGTFNSDGKIKTMGNNKDGIHEYVQLFRNGIIESVGSKYLLGVSESCISLNYFEEKIINKCKNHLKALLGLDIDPPVFIFLTLVGVQNFTRCPDSRYRFVGLERNNQKIQKEILILLEAMIEEYDTNVENELKKTFDAHANACGLERSPSCDENGIWKKE